MISNSSVFARSSSFAYLPFLVISLIFICAFAAANIGAAEIEFDLSVGGSQQSAVITIDSVELGPDENSEQQGIQINPIAGKKKNMTITAELSAVYRPRAG